MTRPRALTVRRVAPAVLVFVMTVVVGCGTGGTEREASLDEGPTPTPTASAQAVEAAEEPGPLTARLAVPAAPTTVLPAGSAAELAVAASATLFASAPLVVLVPHDDPASQERAARAAVATGVPLLLVPPATVGGPAAAGETAASTDVASAPPASPPAAPVPDATVLEVERLGVEAALTFGDVPEGYADVPLVRAPDGDEAVAALLDLPVVATEAGDAVAVTSGLVPGELAALTVAGAGAGAGSGVGAGASPEPGAAPGDLPGVTPGMPSDAVRVLSTGEQTQLAAVATARAAGAEVLLVPSGDPRATSATVQALAGAQPATTLALGPAFGDAATLQAHLSTAATGVELPGGGQLVLPGKTYVALYGSPITASLGVLGEQGPEATISRAKEHASWYTDLTGTTVVPTLEIIATVASGDPGSDGDYSNEWPVDDLRPLVDLARRDGLYVVLDLQPGRSDFLSQAQEYEELLLEPHVGLALDPEWRLGPDERHLRQIGQVSVEEVDTVVTYLADLTRDNDLPQKLLVLHQFQVRMIPGVESVDRSRSELAVLVHVDGQGSQPAKQDTWRVLRRSNPTNPWWGWKNFYDEDSPMLTPEQTMQVDPVPQFITYQ